MNYNKIRHLELVKRLQDLENQGKSLYTENQEEYFELSDYRSTILDNIFWNDKLQYILLMEDCINDFINAEEFSDKFNVLYTKNVDESYAVDTNFEKLENFQPDLRSDGFNKFISFLRTELEDFEPDSTFESGDLSTEKLKNSIRYVRILFAECFHI